MTYPGTLFKYRHTYRDEVRNKCKVLLGKWSGCYRSYCHNYHWRAGH